MRAILVFGAGLLVVVVTLAALLWMLRPRLRSVLVDVLGTEARAGFWVAVASWWIGIVGLLAGTATFGYSSGIGGSGGDLLAALLTQLRTFLAGLLGALLVVALLLLRAMRREPEGRGARAVRVDPPAPARLVPRPPAPPESWPVS